MAGILLTSRTCSLVEWRELFVQMERTWVSHLRHMLQELTFQFHIDEYPELLNQLHWVAETYNCITCIWSTLIQSESYCINRKKYSVSWLINLTRIKCACPYIRIYSRLFCIVNTLYLNWVLRCQIINMFISIFSIITVFCIMVWKTSNYPSLYHIICSSFVTYNIFGFVLRPYNTVYTWTLFHCIFWAFLHHLRCRQKLTQQRYTKSKYQM